MWGKLDISVEIDEWLQQIENVDILPTVFTISDDNFLVVSFTKDLLSKDGKDVFAKSGFVMH